MQLRLGQWLRLAGDFRLQLKLAALRESMRSRAPGELASFDGYQVRITDGPNLFIQYKDEFLRKIYHFEATRPDPLIIDGGSNIGLSILYFKRLYPRARVIAFEPDPAVFGLLEENVRRNRLGSVELIPAGLGATAGQTSFVQDGTAGGRVEDGGGGIAVRIDRLSDYLAEPVDFLKLNIEGQELAVLQEAEAAGRLGNVRELVLEYHGWPGRAPQRLGAILELLDRNSFRYLVHDFDAETCASTKPPFHLGPETVWFCLVYARRMSDELAGH